MPGKGPGSPVRGPVFGTSLLGSLASFDPDTLSWRTSQRCLLEEWVRFSGRWPRSGMTRSGTLFQLRPLVRRTGGTAFGSSRSIPTPRAFVGPVIADRVKVFAETGTPMRRKDGGEYHRTLEEYATVFPTPTADAAIGAVPTPEMAERFRSKGRSGSFVEAVAATMWPTPKASAAGPDFAELGRSKTGISLATAAAMFPTPTVQDASNNSGPSQYQRNSLPLNAVAGGSLNPTWVEWLMGFPLGWTALDASETP